MSDLSTISVALEDSRSAADQEWVPALVIAWSVDEPHRLGEVALFDGRVGEYVLGRGGAERGETRVCFFRQRPGELVPTAPLQDPAISRRQLVVRVRGKRLEVEGVGRCSVFVRGALAHKAVVDAGDTIMLGAQLLLLCVRRPPVMNTSLHYNMQHAAPFGECDAHGMLGESPVAWQLRDDLVFAASAGKHILIRGASGTGKELAARAIHHHSVRASKPFVARNAATLPSGLIDAELFGNAKNYPNPGMAERPGLVGQAHEGTLFLDEIAELPSDLQSHLLRVLDCNGEYQRLGEASPRHSDFVLVGATNREPEALKHDLLARLALRIGLAPLEARREDIPLLVRHIMFAAARRSPHVERFLSRESGRVRPRVELALIDHLVRRQYETHVRELDSLLWRAMAESRKDTVVLPAELRTLSTAPPEPTAEELRSTLEREKGNVRRAAQALGLPSRYALYRLMKKRGIELNPPTEPGKE